MITKLLGLVILAGSLAFAYLYENSGLATGAFRVFHWPAMILTGIGPLGLVLLCSDFRRLKTAFGFLTQLSAQRLTDQYESESDILQKVSQRYYLHGARVFDELKTVSLSPPLQRTLNRLAMRIPVADVRNLLEREESRYEARLEQAISLFGMGVRLSPSIGMLGTILGMVQLLASLTVSAPGSRFV